MNEILKLHKGNYSGEVQTLKEYAGFITSKTTYSDKYNSEFHYHENPHLSLILQGGNQEHKSAEKSLKSAGDVLFYHSGELHKTIPTDRQTKNLNLEIDAHFLAANHVSEAELKQAVEERFNSRLFMLKVHSELQLNDTITEKAIQISLLGFLKEHQTRAYDSVKWLTELHAILNDEWNINHSLSELSVRLGVHPVTISKNFRNYFGCSYGDYVRKLRIDRSLALIKNTGASLTEIALMCGFADQSHFIRVFKTYTGLNPKYFQRL